ncbi:MAG: hypothetical protein PVG14_10175 [Anaerolineales bacterium]|jgi:hypothetical protein
MKFPFKISELRTLVILTIALAIWTCLVLGGALLWIRKRAPVGVVPFITDVPLLDTLSNTPISLTPSQLPLSERMLSRM